MKFRAKIIAFVQDIWHALAAWRDGLWFWTGRYRIENVEDLPERLKSRVLYVIFEGSTPVYAAMACPRKRCTDCINLNLLDDDDPVWALKSETEGPSLLPSIWRRTSCGCHFWMRRGRLHWC